MKKVAFYTLGCKLNYSETSTIGRMFEQRGYRKVGFEDQPDIYIINTCSVTDNADKKCRKVVREALRISSQAYIAIIGCYAQLKPKEIADIPGVDAVLGAAEKFQLLDILDGFKKHESPQVFATEINAARNFNHAFSLNDRTRTFLKVQDGCNYNCSFCTIPLARGKSRSDSIANILEDAIEISKNGVKEVVLTGVNIGDFGIQGGIRKEKFIDLVKAMDKVDGLERIRISSIEPNLLTHDIIEAVSNSQRFVPHFHIPLQSGSDKILKLMRRRYDLHLDEERIQAIKSLMPWCCIGVDVIVGFPGESQEDFLSTYRFLNQLDISYLHVFTYSERSNTPATSFDSVVPKELRRERSAMLRILSDKKRRSFYEYNLGKTRNVLFEADVENSMMQGFTDNYVRVQTDYDPLWVNEIKPFRLTHINQEGVVEGHAVVSNLEVSQKLPSLRTPTGRGVAIS
ncbi:MAG: tRNA (N(6)-L-threonylcarbamoyladenosine(37)-C(2))-methylthiotransferase MtaB [Bacteroidetes bacterium]|nr:tRNA (N(6)-L-threonylcarbamoyladenosine(37)-C(2))-methylthiotransferase MtaB [Bacteroidota bacterium]